MNKIAFICHESAMYIHYCNVWKKLDPTKFAIILTGDLADNPVNNQKFKKKFLAEIGGSIEIFDLKEIQKKGLFFKYVISNHLMGKIHIESRIQLYKFINLLIQCKNFLKNSYHNIIIPSDVKAKQYRTCLYLYPKEFIPKSVGSKQIRFMYGPDISDGWSLGDWNSIYDLVLCHGEADSEKIREKFGIKTMIMGYPRYDNYFNDDGVSEKIRNEFNLTENEQVLYWMPTVDAFNQDVCSIPFYAELLTHQKKYKIIVRPHPFTYRTHPHLITLLEKNEYLIDRDSMRDTSEIFKISAAVLCDHGGSAFGAFYLKKKLIFLETPNHEKAKVFKNSSNQELASYFPMLNKNNIVELESLIEDRNLWNNIYQNAEEFYRRTYGDYFGCSADRAASILKNLDSILK